MKLKKGFDKHEGVFVRGLDKALSSFNVERQAYFGGTFIGNHVHRALKVYAYRCMQVYYVRTSVQLAKY